MWHYARIHDVEIKRVQQRPEGQKQGPECLQLTDQQHNTMDNRELHRSHHKDQAKVRQCQPQGAYTRHHASAAALA